MCALNCLPVIDRARRYASCARCYSSYSRSVPVRRLVSAKLVNNVKDIKEKNRSKMVYQVTSAADMKAKLAEAGDKLVVVDFFATWCGPCKMIAPQLEELSKERPEIVFLKVDVDDHEDLAAEYEIASMPTFVFIKNGEKVDSFSGASLDRLKSTIEKYQ